ncbi:MAG: FHA domain-containing protein [Chitinivibrionia bacterium]|nr:FHA domain-containing protein [Chitinivibrionia bacterium]
MIKAIVYHNAELIKTYEFSKSPVSVGRLPHNNIPINSMGVSRQHLQISYDWDKKAYFVDDLGSTNGTFIDDKKITNMRVESGAKITLGEFTIALEFVGEPPVAVEVASEDLQDSGDNLSSATLSSKDGMFFSKVSSDSETDDEKIVVKAFLIELNNKIIYPINKRTMMFGSVPEDDFYVASGIFDSENIAKLTINNGEYLIQGKKFKHNGNKVSKCVLQNKDRIEIGNCVFTFKIKAD